MLKFCQSFFSFPSASPWPSHRATHRLAPRITPYFPLPVLPPFQALRPMPLRDPRGRVEPVGSPVRRRTFPPSRRQRRGPPLPPPSHWHGRRVRPPTLPVPRHGLLLLHDGGRHRLLLLRGVARSPSPPASCPAHVGARHRGRRPPIVASSSPPPCSPSAVTSPSPHPPRSRICRGALPRSPPPEAPAPSPSSPPSPSKGREVVYDGRTPLHDGLDHLTDVVRRPLRSPHDRDAAGPAFRDILRDLQPAPALVLDKPDDLAPPTDHLSHLALGHLHCPCARIYRDGVQARASPASSSSSPASSAGKAAACVAGAPTRRILMEGLNALLHDGYDDLTC